MFEHSPLNCISPTAMIVFGAAVLLPLLQGIVWWTGCHLNRDLVDQFSFDGSRRDSWGDFYLTLFFCSGAQFVVGIILGGLTGWANSRTGFWRPFCLAVVGFCGSGAFGWLLWHGWNFNRNNCDAANGCAATSPIVLDFQQVVFLGCPLLWCLGTLLMGLVVRTGTIGEEKWSLSDDD